jgi:hypothetical protein
LWNGLIHDGDARFGQELFNITEAESESMETSPGVTDNFGRNAMTQVAEEWVVHCHNLPIFGLLHTTTRANRINDRSTRI